MTCTCVIYNNSLMTLEYCINSILYTRIQKNQIQSCELQETSSFYFINVKCFHTNENIFEIYYKNNFLILQIKLRDSSKKILLTRMFYLTNINLSKLSHIYYKDELKLEIPKIYNN